MHEEQKYFVCFFIICLTDRRSLYRPMSVIQSLLELPDTLNNSLPDDELKLLDKTVTFFSQYQSFQLVNWTCKEGGPWDKATNHGYNLQVKIDDSLIPDYFKTIIK